MFPYILVAVLALSFSSALPGNGPVKAFIPKSGQIPASVRNGEDLDILLKNVSTISIGGQPGFISAYGPDAFPVLCGQMGSSTGIYHPIVVGSRLGEGKLLGTSHDGLFNVEEPVKSNRNDFILNSISWVSGKSNPIVAVIRSEEDSIVGFLRNNSIITIPIPLEELTSADQLRNFDVVLAKEFFNSSYAPIFTTYTERGGGLIMTLTSWAYYYFLEVNGHFGANFPGNMVSTKAGFAWHGDALANPTSPDGSYNASRGLLENTKVLDAWERVKETINAGYPEDPEAGLQRYSTVLEYGFEVIPPNDPFWAGDYYTEAQNYTQTGGQPIPSQQSPVKNESQKFELQVFHALSSFVLKPEDMPVHPASVIFPGDLATRSSDHSSEQIIIKFKKPSWFNEFTRSSKDPWNYVPNSINTCHEGDEDASRSFSTAADENIEVSNKQPLWFSTGLYARPGQAITVTLQSEYNLDSYAVQIGSHTDDVGRLSEWFRPPRIALKSDFVNNTITIASPYGGLIYVLVPEKEILEEERTIKVLVSGSTRAPFFRLGVTQKREWMDRSRHEPGPWAEFVSDNIVLTVPSASIRDLDDPEDLLLFWDQAMDAIADLAAIPRERYRQERMVPDIQISAGFMHSGYPIMTFLNEGNMAVNVTLLREEGSWGHFHELGHNHQNEDWTFGGTGEVTCNLFALYVLNTVCGIPTEKTRSQMTPPVYKASIEDYIASGLNFNNWKGQPFFALMHYVQLQRVYGWAAFKQVFAKYHDLSPSERPVSDQQKMDMWMVMFSTVVQEDLSSLFLSWGFPLSEEARNSVSQFPTSGLSMTDLLNDE